ncbi:MAG: hypothetical protein WDZ27_00130 [Waddliaceae bacterium]
MNNFNLLDVAYTPTHYLLSDNIKSEQKDGKRQLTVGFLAMNRLSILAEQAKHISPSPNISNLAYIPLIIGINSKLVAPYAKQYLDDPKKNHTILTDLIPNLIVKVDKVLSPILDHADEIINVICGVSYVAMIVLGFPISGAIGIAGLICTLAKRNGWMPAGLDRAIRPFLIIACIISDIRVPRNIIIKSLSILLYASWAIHTLLGFEVVRKILPKALLQPTTGTFSVNQKALESIDEEMLENDDNFVVNLDHIHSPMLENIFTKEFDSELESVDPTQLLNDICTKAQSEGFEIEVTYETGLARLKNILVNGRLDDETPGNVNQYIKMVKAKTYSILKSSDFVSELEEFLFDIEGTCGSGITKNAYSIFRLNSKNATYEQSIHNRLAEFREALINDIVRKMPKSKTESILMESVGGTNNIHLLEQVHQAFWHIYRTPMGQAQVNLNGIKPLSAAIIHYFHPGQALMRLQSGQKMSKFQQTALVIHFAISMSDLPPAFLFSGGHQKLLEELEEDYTAENIVDIVYEACKPEVINRDEEEAKEDSIVPPRIEWDVTKWLSSQEEINNGLDEDLINLNPNYVEKVGQRHYLTKPSIRLLLAQLGIIRPKSEHEKKIDALIKQFQTRPNW